MPEIDDKRLTATSGDHTRHQIIAAVAPVLEDPSASARLSTQVLHGEIVHVFNTQDGYAHVQCRRDRYVGWVPVEALSTRLAEPTHKVSTPLTHGYSEPDLKSPPVGLFSLGALVAVTEEEGDWCQCGTAGWIHQRHLAPVYHLMADPVVAAEQLIGAPYLWGGRLATGIDCTGLTQQCLETAGILLPRDSDMQYAWCGVPLEDWQAPGALKRGDLVFWKGHVGIMADSQQLIHANAWHMAVAQEPLAGAIERIANYYAEPIGARRLDISSDAGAEPVWKRRLAG